MRKVKINFRALHSWSCIICTLVQSTKKTNARISLLTFNCASLEEICKTKIKLRRKGKLVMNHTYGFYGFCEWMMIVWIYEYLVNDCLLFLTIYSTFLLALEISCLIFFDSPYFLIVIDFDVINYETYCL